MTLPALILVALSFFLALVCSWVILSPFFELEEAPEALRREQQRDSLKELRLKKESMLDALEDLESDFMTARVEQPDYERAKSELSSEAAEVLSSIDLLEADGPVDTGPGDNVTASIPRKRQR